MYSYLKNTTVTANNNASYGIKFLDSDGNYTLNTRITNCILTANGNKMSDGIYFGGTSEIKNSALTANDNEASGINFDLDAAVTDSTLYADSNTKYGITSRYGTVDITDSFLFCIDEAAGLYHYGASNTDKTKYNPSPINILGTTVARLDSVRDIGESTYGRTFVLGGSVQGIRDKMDTTNIADAEALNGRVDLVKETPDANGWVTAERIAGHYCKPINVNGTMLTRFDLNKEFDHGTALTDENGIYKFTTIDPNLAKNAAYDYTFRYNTKGEDLVEDEKDNAYIWSPVTVITYDATEGAIADAALGTAQKGNVVLNSHRDGQDTIGNIPVVTTVTTTDPETGAETSEEFSDYIDATDYTICGNSMALSEAVLPAASRSGYSFSGWYYAKGAENIEKAAQMAATGKFTELYALLKSDKGAELTSDTLTAADGDDMETITVYALWDKESESGGGGHTDYYKVTVNYYDKETGKKIATSYVSDSLRENSRYDVTDKDAISIEGYAYDSTTGDPRKGTMDKDKVIDVWYVANEEIPDPEVPTDPGQELQAPEVPTTDVPKTGNSSLLWLAAGVSGVGLVWLTIADKKRKNF